MSPKHARGRWAKDNYLSSRLSTRRTNSWRECLTQLLLLLTRTHGSELQGVEQAWDLDLAPRMGQMSSLRARALVARIGSPLVVTEPDQGRVASLCLTVAKNLVDGPAQ